jgi:serine/threonine protein kinase
MIKKVWDKYDIEGKLIDYVPCTGGHINDTYHVRFAVDGDIKEYIFQKINHYVFKEPEKIMDNIKKISQHWKSVKSDPNGKPGSKPDNIPDCDIITFLDSKEGENFVVLEEEYWRVCPFIPNSISYERIDAPELLSSAGYAFGCFQYVLSDFSVDQLHETIPDFHNTKKRMADFFEMVALDPVGRVKDIKEEIRFFENYRDVASELIDMQEKGEIPLRVTHNDTKYNNILIDKDTHKPLCIIDLDTVMPGLSMYDFGDAIRFAANTGVEDETDLSKVGLSLKNYEAFTLGFIKASRDFLTKKELDNMALGAIIITIEQASRFLADYINGDKYYRIHREKHNLDRARCQIKLAADMVKKYDIMDNIIKRC